MKTNGPWKIKGSKETYTNPWITVREDQVIRPDGKDGIYGVVEMVPGISVLALDEEGYVYLTKEFHYAVEQAGIEVVSGAIDKGETPLEAAKRELKEELGIAAEEWIDLGIVNPFTSVVHSPAALFLAKKVHFTESSQEGTETMELLKIPFQEAVRLVMDSNITHGPSCLVILKAAEYLRRTHSL